MPPDLRTEPNLAIMRLCLKHGEAYDVRGNSDGHAQQCQLCHLDWDDHPWPGYDRNAWVDICHCCCADVTPAGSRWSTFYCKDCRVRVTRGQQVNRMFDPPMGRNLIMNDVLVSGPRALDGTTTSRLADATLDMSSRIQLIWEIRERDLGRVLPYFEALHDGDTLLVDVLERAGLVRNKREAFREFRETWMLMRNMTAMLNWEHTRPKPRYWVRG
ncbi:MAG: hypothetical protein WEA29_01525 [Acidimicrobiia bacterium]